MKLTNKELWNLYLADQYEDDYEEECERVEAERENEWEDSEHWRETMRSLVTEWLIGGDEMSGSIWSDMWKDEYGIRPRYSKEEVAYLYNIPYGEVKQDPEAEAVWDGQGFEGLDDTLWIEA